MQQQQQHVQLQQQQQVPQLLNQFSNNISQQQLQRGFSQNQSSQQQIDIQRQGQKHKQINNFNDYQQQQSQKEKENNNNSQKSSKNLDKENKVNVRVKHVNKYYKVLEEVGSGAYGRVYKAESLKTKQLVALKKFESNDEKTIQNGFPITALREIKLLKQLNHKNVIKLHEIIVTKASERNKFRGSTFMVFDYMHHDFAGLFKAKYSFPYGQIKSIIQQILQGVNYLHQNGISHRDLKIANILLNNKGTVVIADFGLARNMPNTPNMQYTIKVVTLWYRAPELLLGLKRYSTQIDMWSVGCILAEFLCGDNLLKGDGEVRQMEKIYELCGSPDEKSWEGVTSLPYYGDLKPRNIYPRRLKEQVLKKNPQVDEVGLQLLDKLLELDPSKRLTAEQALQHPFFTTDPVPQPIVIDKVEECHEMTLQKKKKKMLAQNQQQQIQNPAYKNISGGDEILNNQGQQQQLNNNNKGMQQQQQQQQGGIYNKNNPFINNSNGSNKNQNQPGNPFVNNNRHMGNNNKYNNMRNNNNINAPNYQQPPQNQYNQNIPTYAQQQQQPQLQQQPQYLGNHINTQRSQNIQPSSQGKNDDEEQYSPSNMGLNAALGNQKKQSQISKFQDDNAEPQGLSGLESLFSSSVIKKPASNKLTTEQKQQQQQTENKQKLEQNIKSQPEKMEQQTTENVKRQGEQLEEEPGTEKKAKNN